MPPAIRAAAREVEQTEDRQTGEARRGGDRKAAAPDGCNGLASRDPALGAQTSELDRPRVARRIAGLQASLALARGPKERSLGE